MTRDEAIATVIISSPRVLNSLRNERPQRLCDRLELEAAADTVDALIALGLLKVDDITLSDVGQAQLSGDK